MKRYLLSIYQPDGPPPADVDLEKVMVDIATLIDDAKSAGAWVFNGGLFPPETATVVRPGEDDLLVTDGPYLEGKEHIGGFWVIDVPDLDTALALAAEGSQACGGTVEVRPFQSDVG